LSSPKRLLIIDQLNLFFRNYIVNPSLSLNGQPIGGLRGCIQSIQKIVRETKPDRIIICWDGPGGSSKRKLIKKDYKAGRKPIRLNRAVRNLSEDDEMDNKVWQQTRLIDYFNSMPVIQFMFDGTEADDIIAYVSKMPCYKDWQKIIVSSDKDFFQLLDDNTVLYRPIQKEVLSKKTLIERFDVHPNNFAMARAMVGDKSDNLEGVGGIGLKTVSKRFSFFSGEESVTFDMVLDHCRQTLKDKSLKAFENILENEDILRRNYKMMQLYVPTMMINDKKLVNETMDDPDTSFNKTEVLRMMMKDGFGEINFSELFQHFNKMVIDAN